MLRSAAVLTCTLLMTASVLAQPDQPPRPPAGPAPAGAPPGVNQRVAPTPPPPSYPTRPWVIKKDGDTAPKPVIPDSTTSSTPKHNDFIGLKEMATSAKKTSIVIGMGETVPFNVSDDVKTVIVGNPSVGDVQPQGDGVIYLVGKTYGITSLTIMNGNYEVIGKIRLSVTVPKDGILTVQKGADIKEAYVCIEEACYPYPMPGTSQQFYTQAQQQRGSAGGPPGAGPR